MLFSGCLSNRLPAFLSSGVSLISLLLPLFLQAQQPSVRGSMPRDGATGLIRNAFISVRLDFVEKKTGIDPETLNDSTVRLFPAGQPDSLVKAFLNFSNPLSNLTLEPIELLEPNQDYIFEINAGLQDEEGRSFEPYTIRFSTGEGALTKHITMYRPKPKPLSRPVSQPAPVYLASTENNVVPGTVAPRPLNSGTLVAEKKEEKKTVTVIPPQTEKPEIENAESRDPVETQTTGEIAATETVEVPVAEEITAPQKTNIEFSQSVIGRNGKLKVEFAMKEATEVKYLIKDSKGRTVKRGVGEVPQGIHTRNMTLGLDPGEYKISFKVGDEVFSQVFTILR